MNHLILSILFGVCSFYSFSDHFNGVVPSESSNFIIGLLFFVLAIDSLLEKK